MINQILKSIAGASLLIGLTASAHGSSPKTTIAYKDTPNIVLILADDLGFTDTAPYGSEIQTPNISKLADDGVLFTNYHTAATCAPSRAMLLTGVDSHRNGVPNIPEVITPEQAEKGNYNGTLNHNVVTIATLLKDAGYHTYMTGKWHLGKKPDLLPSQRGFERTVAMLDSGADNWEKKTYAPLYANASWYADGKEIDLPDDFYSSKFFIDKSIEFIESNRQDGKPFFSYIPFQAVHIPVQAPQEFTDKYMGKYDKGWDRLRQSRLEQAKRLNIVPEETQMVNMATTTAWKSLSQEEQRYESKKMAVYAGMVDAMDYHIGRLVRYLKETDQYDNTVFVFTSDNGAEANDVFKRAAWQSAYAKLWLKNNGYNFDYETLGTKGSYINMGHSFASAAASPLAFYKFFVGEGGMRVPLIISGKKIPQKGKITNAFTFVTDIAPTILGMAGVNSPENSYQGRDIEPIVGKSLLPITDGKSNLIHDKTEAIGHELSGHAALFKGDYKIVKNRGPEGDSQWHLYNIITDPGETNDLRNKMPKRFSTMMEDYRTYVRDNNVQPVADDYSQSKALTDFTIRRSLRAHGHFYAMGIVSILAGILIWVRIRSKSKKKKQDEMTKLTNTRIIERIINKTLKPFLIIAGFITMLPGILVISPAKGLMEFLHLKLLPEYTLLTQHWGLMVFLVGLLMVVSVFKKRFVNSIMLYAALEKAGMVVLFLINSNQPWAAGFTQAAMVDTFCVFYALLYFYQQYKTKYQEKN